MVQLKSTEKPETKLLFRIVTLSVATLKTLALLIQKSMENQMDVKKVHLSQMEKDSKMTKIIASDYAVKMET